MIQEHDFRTPPSLKVNIDWPWQKLPLGAKLAAVGSCFAQEISSRLLEAGFRGAQNPNGIIYNAVSMADAVERAVDGPEYSVDDFFEHGGLWHSWLHHGSFSARDVDEAVDSAEASRQEFREALEGCELFIATPASSSVYELLSDGQVVSNCHKVPNSRFNRRLLSVEENLEALKRTVEAVRGVSPECPVVLTLSPVRHYPGDLVLNARSKAHLLAAIHRCCESFENVRYFPAFEIVIDELRDYRFFKEDMLHPSELAAEIVLRTFADVCFEKGVQDLLDAAIRVRKAEGHRKRGGD